MGTGWNYSDLTKLAKQHGGPEMLLHKIKYGSYQKGIEAGKKESLPWIITSALIAGGVIAYEEGPKIIRAVKNKFIRNNAIMEGEIAEDILRKQMMQDGPLDDYKDPDFESGEVE